MSVLKQGQVIGLTFLKEHSGYCLEWSEEKWVVQFEMMLVVQARHDGVLGQGHGNGGRKK